MLDFVSLFKFLKSENTLAKDQKNSFLLHKPWNFKLFLLDTFLGKGFLGHVRYCWK